jgi:hypothetical protein
VNLEPVIEAKLLGFVDGLTVNLGIIKTEYERVLCLFQQANKAKRAYFANWQAAAAENRRLVGVEQDVQHYKEEAEEAQAQLKAQMEAMRLIVFAMFGRDLEPTEQVAVVAMVEWIEGLRAENTKLKELNEKNAGG